LKKKRGVNVPTSGAVGKRKGRKKKGNVAAP